MKKLFLTITPIITALCFLYAPPAGAYGSWGDSVNLTCKSSFNCGICHVDPDGGGTLTPDGKTWKSDRDDTLFCPAPEPPACVPETEVCDDGIDNDCDGLVDLDDSADCEPACVPETEICSDGIDNDCDGLIDLDDSADCEPACIPEAEVCNNGADEDCDGLIDLDDPDCPSCVPETEICDDGIDNDCDGLIDLSDTADCEPPCTDGDSDGWCLPTDCDDGNPDIFPGAFDICLDGVDQDCSGNDRTGGADCPAPPPPPPGDGGVSDSGDSDDSGVSDSGDSDDGDLENDDDKDEKEEKKKKKKNRSRRSR